MKKEKHIHDKRLFYSKHVIEKELKHHLVEWGATALSVGGAILNSNQYISGFYVWTVANLLWISFGLKHKHYGLVVMNIVFLCINAWGILTWWRNPFVIFPID